MKLRLLFTLLALSFVFPILYAQEKAIQEFINNPILKHASIGFCVKDFDGKIIAAHNPEQAYTPASILKVITTASALELLGADYRYETPLLIQNHKTHNRLVIDGSGDPTLGTEYLNNNPKEFITTWTNATDAVFKDEKQKGIEVYVIDDLFGYQGISRKWIYEDIGNYYGSGSYGISVFDNTYKISFNTEDTNTAPKIISTSPVMRDIKFTNTLTLNNTGRDNGYIVGAPFSNERSLIGNIPAGKKSFSIKGAIPDPGLYLGQTIANSLKAKGYKITEVKTSRETYLEDIYTRKSSTESFKAIYRHLSPSLSQIIRDVNVRSNNHYAEHLIRTLGSKQRTSYYDSALDEGVNAIKKYWSNKGINSSSLFMYDGSGLAPTNALSASFMCDVLGYMQTKSKNAEAFLLSFPIAGEEGTVRSLLKDTRLQGKVFVKSGSIANVQCFAGYYIDGNKKYSFTIMTNKFNGTNRQVIQAIEKLLLATLK